MIESPFLKTLEKFNHMKQAINDALIYDDFETIDKEIASLREYTLCHYCIAYRQSLSQHFAGCCDTCPLHKKGEEEIGRKRSYNGCYVIGCYKDLVKTAFWYKEDRSRETAEAVINCLNNCLQYMQENRHKLEL